MLDWCRAVRGSRSRAGAGREIEDRTGGERMDGGEEMDAGERAEGDWERVKEDSDSMVMAGQKEEEEGVVGVGKVSTGGGVDSGAVTDPTLEHAPEPEPEIKPAWTFDGKGLVWFNSDD